MPIKTVARTALFALAVLGLCDAARADYYSQPQELDITGNYTQNASGMEFPETVAGFMRNGIVRYNSEGSDEEVDYLLDMPGKEIGISVYVYPVPANLGEELAKALPRSDLYPALLMFSEQLFADEEQGILQVHPGGDLLDEKQTSHNQPGISYPGYVAAFRYREEFFGRTQRVRSELYLFPMVGKNWMVKYRITYPDGLDASTQVDAFMRALAWTIHEAK
jgi:hypothetical protein